MVCLWLQVFWRSGVMGDDWWERGKFLGGR